MNGSSDPGRPNHSGERDELPRPDPAGEPVAGSGADVRLTAWVRGRVQGVGFRWWTRATALEIGGLAGYVSNLGDGRVQVVAEGSPDRCGRLLEWLRHGATPGRVDGVTEIWSGPRGGYEGFRAR